MNKATTAVGESHRITLEDRQHRLSLRACQRAFRNAWKGGELEFHESYGRSALSGWILSLVMLSAIALLGNEWLPRILLIWHWEFHPDLPNADVYAILHCLTLAFLVGVLGLMLAGTIYILWLELSGSIAASVRMTSHQIEVERRDGRRTSAEWRDFMGIRSRYILFRHGLKVRLPSARNRAALMIHAIEQELLPDKQAERLRAASRKPWRMIVTGCVVSLASAVFLSYYSDTE